MIAPESETEINVTFLQKMCNAMGMSLHAYGRIKDAYPKKVDAIKSLETRLQKYKDTGNTDYLVDVANFSMIEFTYPAHPNAYYKPTDSHESSGRNFHGELDRSKRRNDEI